MKLNGHILIHHLNGIIDARLSQDASKLNIQYISYINQNTILRSDCIYISEASEIPETFSCSNTCLIVFLGSIPNTIVKNPNCDYICCEAEQTKSEVFQKIHEVFEYYNNWEKRLQKALYKRKSLDEMCTISAPIFNNPIMVVSKDYYILASSANGESKYKYDSSWFNRGFICNERMQLFLAYPDFERTFEERIPEFFSLDNKFRSLGINLYQSNNYIGAINVDGIIDDMFEGCKGLLNLLGEYVIKSISLYALTNMASIQNYSDAIISCLQNNTVPSPASFISFLHELNWSKNDNYICTILDPFGRNSPAFSIPFDIYQISTAFSECMSVEYEKMLVLFYNVTKSNLLPDELIQRLNKYVIKVKLISATSTVFQNFFDFPIYYKQANACLKIGKDLDPNLNHYRFDDYALRFVLKYGLQAIPVQALLPAGLQKMLLYDQEHDSEYFKTLCIYLENNCSLTQCSKILYIHVNTMKYRYVKMKEMLQLNLEDSDTRLYLMLMVKLIRSDNFK